MLRLTPIVVSNLYDRCAETRPHRYVTVDIAGFESSQHRFTPLQLKKYKREVSLLLRHLYPEFMRSNNNHGFPWIFARKDSKGHEWCGNLNRVEQLLILGAAMNLVTITKPTHSPDLKDGEMPWVVVEDSRINKLLKMN